MIFDSGKYENCSLGIMQNKYFDLLKTFEKEKFPNFVEDTIKLISLSDEYNVNILFLLFNTLMSK